MVVLWGRAIVDDVDGEERLACASAHRVGAAAAARQRALAISLDNVTYLVVSGYGSSRYPLAVPHGAARTGALRIFAAAVRRTGQKYKEQNSMGYICGDLRAPGGAIASFGDQVLIDVDLCHTPGHRPHGHRRRGHMTECYYIGSR